MSTRACPVCGARNAAGAPWCTQCYASFGDLAEARGPAVSPRPAADGAGPRPPGSADPPGEPSAAAGAADGPAAAGGPVRAGSTGDVRQDDHGAVEWRCRTCDGWSPLEAAACVTCGSARRGFGEDRELDVPDEQRVVLLSGMVPGLGHIVAGRVGSGLARAVFGLGWLIGGVLLLLAAMRAGGGHWASAPLLVGAAVVWVLSVLDARSLARGQQREHLDGRTLLWLMVGVTCLLLLGLMLDVWRLAG